MTFHPSKSEKHSLAPALLFIAAGHIASGLLAELFFLNPLVPWIIVFITYAAKIPGGKYKDKPVYSYLINFMQGFALTMFLVILVIMTGGKTVLFGNIAIEAYANFTRVITFFLAAVWILSALVVFTGQYLGKTRKLDKTTIAKFLFIFGVAAFILLVVNISVVFPWLKQYDAILILVIFVSIYSSLVLAGHINGKK